MKRRSVGQHRRPIWAMPVEGLIDHPKAIALPSSGFSILCRLVLHYWQTECTPLPIADHELRSIGRGHAPTWRHHKPVIMQILADILPALEKAYIAKASGADALRIAGRRGLGARRLAAQQKTSHTHTAAEAPVQTAPVKRRQDSVGASVIAATTDTRKLRTDRI